MVSLVLAMKKLVVTLWEILKQEETRALLIILVITLFSGTMFYSQIEHLDKLDALWLSFTTLTTIGYGDLYPVTTIGKVFTMIYAMVGLGIMSVFISLVARQYLSHKKQHHHKKHEDK